MAIVVVLATGQNIITYNRRYNWKQLNLL